MKKQEDGKFKASQGFVVRPCLKRKKHTHIHTYIHTCPEFKPQPKSPSTDKKKTVKIASYPQRLEKCAVDSSADLQKETDFWSPELRENK
jgi:hypothetical protein